MSYTNEQKEIILARHLKSTAHRHEKSTDFDALLEEHRDWNTDDEWWDCVYDNFVEHAKTKGFDVASKSIFFSGFGHQGQYATFKADVDLESWTKANKTQILADFDETEFTLYLANVEDGDTFTVETNSKGDSCFLEDKLSPIWVGYGYDERDEREEKAFKKYQEMTERIYEQIWLAIDEQRGDLKSRLFTSLEKEFDFLRSDEQIWEGLAAHYLEDFEDDDFSISITWNVEDIKTRATDQGLKVTTEQAIKILKDIMDSHDAEAGVNWGTIDGYLTELN